MNSIFALYTLYTFLLHYVQHIFSHNHTTILHVSPNLLLRLLYYCGHRVIHSHQDAHSRIYTQIKKNYSVFLRNGSLHCSMQQFSSSTYDCVSFKLSWHLLDLKHELQDIKVHEKKKRNYSRAFDLHGFITAAPPPTTCPMFKKEKEIDQKKQTNMLKE